MTTPITFAAAARSRAAAALRRTGVRVATVGLAAALVLAVPAAGWARDEVATSDPADRSALGTAPAAVNLVLSAVPDPGLSHVSVVDADRRQVGSGDLSLVGERQLRLPVRITARGNYTAAYHITFEDGSELTGVVRFSVGTGVSPPVPDAAGQRADEELAQQHNHDIDPMSGVLLVADLVVLVAVALLLLRRPGRRWTAPPAGTDD